ncbi:hypothetical protein ACW2Q0_10465 [Nocardia sp. R16R-3T]
MTARVVSLETAIEQAGGATQLLRSSTIGPFPFPNVPPEFSNWRDEIRAWKDGVALLELSHHMTEIHLSGPDVLPFLKAFSVNKLDTFPVRRAKQIVFAAPDGNLIADAIFVREEEDFFRIVGLPQAGDDWLMFNLERGDWNIKAVKKERGVIPRDVFRIQIQGPNALPLMTEVADEPLPNVAFFGVGEVTVAGQRIRALRHGMAGTAGFELYGPWDSQWAVREALAVAGEKYGLRKVGDLAYRVTAQESGWLPQTMPPIYSGDYFAEFRQWLDSNSFEANASLGGSFSSDRIEDYYVDPLELGYGLVIDWNRDFIGREALEAKKANPKRKKVALEWHNSDVADAITSSLFAKEGTGARFMALPNLLYAVWEYDSVLDGDRLVGTSQWASYTSNAQHVISSALLAIEDAVPGRELTLLWGESDSKRPVVDAHELRTIRVTVAEAPYFEKVIKTREQ